MFGVAPVWSWLRSVGRVPGLGGGRFRVAGLPGCAPGFVGRSIGFSHPETPPQGERAMARTATIEHTTTGITITVENAPGHYTFDHAADGTYVQGCGEWDGQAVVIYSTARWAYDTEPGDLVTLTGATVKRHSMYDGTPQTTLGGRMKAAKG